MTNTKTIKTIYLEGRGYTAEGKTPRNIFKSNNFKYKNELCKLYLEFNRVRPYAAKQTKSGKNKIVYGEDYSALWIDTQYTTDKGSYRLELPEKLIEILEKMPAPFERYYTFTDKNILTVINYLMKTKYNAVETIDTRYINNKQIEFISDEHEHNETMYNNAIQFEQLAKAKIMQVKAGCRYDNSSYYYNSNGDFEVLIHYNCFNDRVQFDLSNMEEAINKLNNYTIPEEQIKAAYKNYCAKYSIKYNAEKFELYCK